MRYTSVVACAAVALGWSACQLAPPASADGPRTAPATRIYQPEPDDQDYFMIRNIATPGLWDKGFICIARADTAKSRKGGDVAGFVKITTKEEFGDGPTPADFVLPTELLKQYTLGAWQSAGVSPGDTVLLWFYANGKKLEHLQALALSPKEVERWSASLNTIDDYRKAAASAKAHAAVKLLAGMTDLSVQYYCRELWTDSRTISDEEQGLLRKARNDNSLYILTRALASEALHRKVDAYKQKNGHVAWLRGWFVEPANMPYRDCEILLNQLQIYAAPGDFETVDFPAMSKLLISRRTGQPEATCILNWLSHAGSDGRATMEAQDKVVRFLLKLAFQQADLGETDNYLAAAARAMGGISTAALRDREKVGDEVPKALEMLNAYDRLLNEEAMSLPNENMRTYAQSTMQHVKWLRDYMVKEVPSAATNPTTSPAE